jgi:hypothetical protein
MHSWTSMVQHQWILCEKSEDEVLLFHKSLVYTIELAQNFVFLNLYICLSISYGRLATLPSLRPLCCKLEPSKINILHCKRANEGPVRIQYKCLVPIYVFPEMKLLFPKHNYDVLSISVLFPGSVFWICCWEICGEILGIYKSHTDTSMWKLGLRPRNSQKRNT